MKICRITKITPDGKPWGAPPNGPYYPPVEFAREFFDYDKETGSISWKKAPSHIIKSGSKAGSISCLGYRVIGFMGKYRPAHRIAWALHYGVWPHGEIDHINGIRDDNRISNLRIVTRMQNMQNRKRVMRNSKTKVMGVKPFGNKFIARIQAAGIRKHLGLFKTIEEASAAYQAAKAQLHFT